MGISFTLHGMDYYMPPLVRRGIVHSWCGCVWNQSLLAKILWNVHAKKDSLWYRWIHHFYIRQQDFWNWTMSLGDSPLIKYLFRIRGLHALMMRFLVQGPTSIGTLAFQLSFHCQSIVYNFFHTRSSPKPWATLVWAPGLTPKHSMLWVAA